ncbi:MAG: methyltransferase domain-containing protein [Ignavibacteria bacterium]|nr:methyltransferase domain-containing protein [Ignavibacteria bacterium]
MATKNQLKFIRDNKDAITEPVLIVGSKQYDFDRANIRQHLTELGVSLITGIDISEGEGVDHVADITDGKSAFITEHRESFGTVICMEVMTHVLNPFEAARNLFSMLKHGGSMILSECYVRKISKMPLDLWRFTYDGTKQLYSPMKFDDSRARISLTRDKGENLMPLRYPLPQVLYEKSPDESSAGFMLRRIHRKFFSKGIFGVSRLFPETTIYSVAFKNNS